MGTRTRKKIAKRHMAKCPPCGYMKPVMFHSKIQITFVDRVLQAWSLTTVLQRQINWIEFVLFQPAHAVISLQFIHHCLQHYFGWCCCFLRSWLSNITLWYASIKNTFLGAGQRCGLTQECSTVGEYVWSTLWCNCWHVACVMEPEYMHALRRPTTVTEKHNIWDWSLWKPKSFQAFFRVTLWRSCCRRENWRQSTYPGEHVVELKKLLDISWVCSCYKAPAISNQLHIYSLSGNHHAGVPCHKSSIRLSAWRKSGPSHCLSGNWQLASYIANTEVCGKAWRKIWRCIREGISLNISV